METCRIMMEERGIHPTAVRLLVLKAMLDTPQAVSIPDLEAMLDTVDKSTLFRTVILFLRNRLVHSIDDGTGAVKYSVCKSGCGCGPEELHVHFHCRRCGKTYCFEGLPIPAVDLPDGFRAASGNFVLKGTCDRCG